MAQPPKTYSEAAFGGAVGAMLGAAAVAAVVASCGATEMVSTARDALPWFSAIALVIVTQFAVVGAISTLAVRLFAAPGVRPIPVPGWRRK